MSPPALEAFLARLYTDRGLLTLFLADPQRAMAGAGLSAEERESLGRIDRHGLQLAMGSFERKRTARGRPRWRLPGTRWAARLRRWLGW